MPTRLPDPRPMSAEMFRAHQSTLGLTIDAMAAALRVCRSSVEKYRSGALRVPGPVAALMEAKVREHVRGQN